MNQEICRSLGSITAKPGKNLIPKTIEFLYDSLAVWRVDYKPDNDVSEPKINYDLRTFLDIRGREVFPMVTFNSGKPEHGHAAVDLAVQPVEKTIIECVKYSMYDAFLVIECKRLPTPPPRPREKEYVYGFFKNKSPSGGIQRFKHGIHGGKVNQAVIVGYIQKKSPEHWYRTINGWITELCENSDNPSNMVWSEAECLESVNMTDEGARLESRHNRVREHAISEDIILHHLWVVFR